MEVERAKAEERERVIRQESQIKIDYLKEQVVIRDECFVQKNKMITILVGVIIIFEVVATVVAVI